jgi:outer membrane protein assembly factor BamB
MVLSSPVIVGKNVYFISSDAFLFAIDGGAHSWPIEYFFLRMWTQAAVWRILPYPPSLAGVTVQQQLGMMNVSSAAIENNNVYVGIDFYLVATNLQGKMLWRFTAGDEIASSPAVSGNTVYVGSNDGKIYAVNATTGKQLWNVSTGGKIGSSPALANGMLYVGSYDGKLYAIK